MEHALSGVRVHRVQKVQRVQRGVVAAGAASFIKRGAADAFGHACGVRVDGAAPRGLWPPAGGGLCRRVVKEKVQRVQRAWIAAGGGNEYL